MTFAECVSFATANPICTVATVDGDKPRARIFMMWRANESGFYLCTGTPKPVCQQLIANPNIELCFYKPGTSEQDLGAMMRVSGKVDFVQDIDLRTQLLDEWPFLKEMGIKGPEDPMLSLMKIGTGEIKYWTAGGSAEENVETVAF